MQVDVVRMVADWLGADLNTRIANVPVDGGDPAPPAIAPYTATAPQTATPNNLAIFDETRHQCAADFMDPPAMPALYVYSRGSIAMEGEPEPDRFMRKSKSPVPVVILYQAANSVTNDGIRDAERTLRAIARSLFELSKGVNESSRLRNGTFIVLGEGPQIYDPAVKGIGTGRINAAVGVGFYVRDQLPNY